MQISITAQEIADTLRQQFPQQYEIVVLRLTVDKQGKHAEELEQQLAAVNEEH